MITSHWRVSARTRAHF